jgi:hypothetical protein
MKLGIKPMKLDIFFGDFNVALKFKFLSLNATPYQTKL